MSSPPSQASPDTPRSRNLLTRLRVLGRLLDWLAAVLLLSDEEQEQAGIHLGGHRRA